MIDSHFSFLSLGQHRKLIDLTSLLEICVLICTCWAYLPFNMYICTANQIDKLIIYHYASLRTRRNNWK